MDQILTNNFGMITMCCGMLVIFSSCLYMLVVRNQKSIIISVFLASNGFLMIIASLAGRQPVNLLWLLLTSVLSVMIMWAGIMHLYYRKGGE